MSYLSDPYLTDTFFSSSAFPHKFRYQVKTLSNEIKITKKRLSTPNYKKKIPPTFFLFKFKEFEIFLWKKRRFRLRWDYL